MSADNCIDCYRREVLVQLTELCNETLGDIETGTYLSPSFACLKEKIRLLRLSAGGNFQDPPRVPYTGERIHIPQINIT